MKLFTGIRIPQRPMPRRRAVNNEYSVIGAYRYLGWRQWYGLAIEYRFGQQMSRPRSLHLVITEHHIGELTIDGYSVIKDVYDSITRPCR